MASINPKKREALKLNKWCLTLAKKDQKIEWSKEKNTKAIANAVKREAKLREEFPGKVFKNIKI